MPSSYLGTISWSVECRHMPSSYSGTISWRKSTNALSALRIAQNWIFCTVCFCGKVFRHPICPVNWFSSSCVIMVRLSLPGGWRVDQNIPQSSQSVNWVWCGGRQSSVFHGSKIFDTHTHTQTCARAHRHRHTHKEKEKEKERQWSWLIVGLFNLQPCVFYILVECSFDGYLLASGDLLTQVIYTIKLAFIFSLCHNLVHFKLWDYLKRNLRSY